MDAVILVGGKGTRLQSVVSDRPKPLATVAGLPFLHHILQALEESGVVTRVFLAAGFLADQVKEYVQSASWSFPVEVLIEEKPLGTGGAVKSAWPYMNSDQVLVMNGDSFLDVDLQKMAKAHQGGITIACLQVADAARYGKVELEKEQITAFREKGASGPGYINGGIYIIDRSVDFSSFPEAFSIERDFFPAFVGKGLLGWPCQEVFIDIGTPETYQEAQGIFS